MIITRTPLRISLGGGGTDLPAYYRGEQSGFLIAAAISKYVYIAVNENFDDDILLKYSQIERVGAVDDVQHPILREALRATGTSSRVELSSMADIPTGTGLGSSGSFTVGVLRALWSFQHEAVASLELARQACEIEIERLGEPVGKQDQYIAAVGGITGFEFHGDDRVGVVPIELTIPTRHRVEENLLLFYTGVRRSASEVLAEERDRASGSDELAANLDEVRRLGWETKAALEAGDPHAFGELLTAQWKMKLARQSTPTHHKIDDWIRRGIEAGAVGGKLVGAGGGGFLLFYAEAKADLRSLMAQLGLEEIRFAVDYEGSATIARG